MTSPRSNWTGPGPLPGTDVRAAAEVVVGECPDLPFLPELTGRGIGSDQIGRTAALLADLPVDISTRGWRLTSAPGRAGRRALDLLDRDCDALEEADERSRSAVVDRASADVPDAADTRGGSQPDRRLVARILGPWSLAASLELPGGLLVLTDSGARRDVASSLAEGVARRLGVLAGRLGARPRVILDEPALWRVAAGTVAGASRLDPIAAVPADRLALSLRRFADTLRAAGVADVLVRAPEAREPGAAAQWWILTDTPTGETPLDGLVVPARALELPRRSRDGSRDESPAAEAAKAAAHAALDAAGTTLGDGLVLQLEGLPGDPRFTVERGRAESGDLEHAAAEVFALLDRLSAPRYGSLGRLVLTPTVGRVQGDLAGAARALADVRRFAEALPRLAE